MKTALILGALPDNPEQIQFYEILVNVCKQEGYNVYSPLDTLEFQWGIEERYKRAFDLVKKSDVVIANLNDLSVGMWMEIRESTLLNKPLYAIARQWMKISGLIQASPNLKEIKFYSQWENIPEILNSFFHNYISYA